MNKIFWVLTLLMVSSCKREFVSNANYIAQVGGKHTIVKFKNNVNKKKCVIYGNFYTLDKNEQMQATYLNIYGKNYIDSDKGKYNNGTFKIELEPGTYTLVGHAMFYKSNKLTINLNKKDSVNINFWLANDDAPLK